MVKEVDRACEKLNKKLGVSVSFPNSKKKTLKAASVCNFVVGAGFFCSGSFAFPMEV